MLGLPIGVITQFGPSASSVILGNGDSENVRFSQLEQALTAPQTQLRLFGKPEIHGQRRLGVGLARGENIEEAIEKAKRVSGAVQLQY